MNKLSIFIKTVLIFALCSFGAVFLFLLWGSAAMVVNSSLPNGFIMAYMAVVIILAVILVFGLLYYVTSKPTTHVPDAESNGHRSDGSDRV